MAKKSVAGHPAHSRLPESPFPKIADVAPIVHRVAAGTAMFRQGDATFGICRLVAGQIRLLRVTPDGTEVPMHTVRPGELFAEASIFSRHYHCDAVATKQSEVLVYPKAEVTRQLRTKSEALWEFAAELAHRLQSLRTQMEVRQIRSAPERVLQSLHLRCDSSGRWKQDGTLKQFAEEIGLTHEALYRALAKLERDGRITRGTAEIRLVSDEFVRPSDKE